jgi:hypothetical protein
LLPCHTSWIDVVDVQARSPLIVNGAFYGSDGEAVEAPGMPCSSPDVCSEWPLWVSFTV